MECKHAGHGRLQKAELFTFGIALGNVAFAFPIGFSHVFGHVFLKSLELNSKAFFAHQSRFFLVNFFFF
jgi:hypothetical protein